jgi:hypothetical protein
MYLRLTLTSQSSILHLSSVRITGVNHYSWHFFFSIFNFQVELKGQIKRFRGMEREGVRNGVPFLFQRHMEVDFHPRGFVTFFIVGSKTLKDSGHRSEEW